MSSHQTGAWIQQGSCSERRSMCLYTYDHSRRYLLHMFLANKIKLKFAQGYYNGKKKHHMIQGMVPSTLLFNHIQSSICEQLLNTCVGKIPVSTMSIFLQRLYKLRCCLWIFSSLNTTPHSLMMNLFPSVCLLMPTLSPGWSSDTSHQCSDTWLHSALLNHFS